VRPQRLTSARVYRFYRGGALLESMHGGEARDGDFPEDWIGSLTQAINPGRHEPEAGLSRLADGRLLRDAVAEDPVAWLGTAHVKRFGSDTTGLLVKLLDPAERLPVHAHPSRPFASRHLDSRFGKTEAWFIVDTREGEGEVWVGLREDVAPDTYRGWIDRQDTEALLGSLHRVPVRAGDLVYVPAGVPHAIGGGLLIAELQEASDFSILCEWKGFPIRPEDSHLGLGWDAALDALRLDATEPVRELPPEASAFFFADEHAAAAGRFAVLLVLSGRGRIAGESARRGDAFAVPAAARPFEVEGDLRVLRCLGPDPAA
jgi:mannose-6-phosphate isomerase